MLRQKGQFWTPDWAAEAMVSYLLANGMLSIFDPAVGAGAFLRAAKRVASELGRAVLLSGTELDPKALEEARQQGLSAEDLAHVQIRDFVLDPPEVRLKAIAANPPYLRHHRLTQAEKSKLRRFGAGLLGQALDGRAGLHVYFLLRALQLLDEGGRLAFIMPADTCEGVFSRTLWRWITSNYNLETVVTFSPAASPFPGVDVNPVIFMISNESPGETLYWVHCTQSESTALKDWVLSRFRSPPAPGLEVSVRSLSEALDTGLSRPPRNAEAGSLTLGDFAKVVRGVATGNNSFFFLTKQQVEELSLPDEFLVRAVGRTRDITGTEITAETLEQLDALGRPTLLLSLGGLRKDEFPSSVQEYLEQGEAQGVNRGPLVSTRRPWYKMETRKVPPILFAYLGRRNARFIRNVAGVVPLTGFLCVYPHYDHPEYIEALWRVLSHPTTVENLRLVAKSYGFGAIKVEPRGLEKLPLRDEVVARHGLTKYRPRLF